MDILLKRLHHTRWGVDGQLFIDGRHIADTTEHPTNCLAPGEYPLSLNRLLLCRGNGPMLNTDGTICVGEHLCAGCVLRTREIFTTIYNRIQKALKRGKSVILTIQCMLLVIFLTSCNSLHRAQIVEHSVHDTLYLNKAQYDSIYIDNRQVVDHTGDTVVIREILRENRYKFLHDTARIVHIDSIPVIHTVEVTKTVKQVPSIYKWSLAICIVLLILLIIYVIWKIKF